MNNKNKLALQQLQALLDNFDPFRHSQIAKDMIDNSILKITEEIDQEDSANEYLESKFTSEIVAEFFEDKESLSLMQEYETD
ncbi:MAG: hypothetical protein IE909_10400 [Campylobacterales bacterium]|nr:hypothetical protein [Campylobacterales bacterium]